MKKIIAMLLALTMLVAFAGCDSSNNGGSTESTPAPETTAPETTVPETTAPETTAPVDDPAVKSEGVMTYAEYAAADLDTEVVVECYVQAHQSWWNDSIVVYAQDTEGGYFMYGMTCSEEDSEKLVPGTKIRVTGWKSEYNGEVEITDCTFEILEGSYIAEATDVTSLLADESLADYMNRYITIKGATVAPSTDAEGNEVAFLYSWDGSGTPGSDLYFNITVDGQTYNMCVESYLCGDGTEVYDAVEALNVGDTIDLVGFLYWYNTANPHITGVTVSE